jgi:predicted Zn-dependent protease
MKIRYFAITIATTILLSGVESCVTNSEGRNTYNIVPESQMDSMGVQAYQEILGKSKTERTLVDHSDARYQTVERIGKRIAAASGADFKWEFALIDEPKTVNAFCLPGGKIAVYTGLFPVAQTEAALAAVMGHEVAHATMRHGAERMSQQLTLAGLTAVADMSMQNSQYHDIAVGVFGVGAQFGIILPFSRKHESEADAVGIKYAANAGYNPEAAIGLWERMGASGKSPPEFMSTHPDPSNRREALSRMQEQVRPLYERSEKQPDRKL